MNPHAARTPARTPARPTNHPMSLIRPTLRAAQRSASASFHTYPAAALRVTRDRNPDRGVSPLHRRGQKDPLGAAKYGLPEPVLDMERHTKVVTADDHGMWGFFRNKSGLPTPEENHKHGSLQYC